MTRIAGTASKESHDPLMNINIRSTDPNIGNTTLTLRSSERITVLASLVDRIASEHEERILAERRRDNTYTIVSRIAGAALLVFAVFLAYKAPTGKGSRI